MPKKGRAVKSMRGIVVDFDLMEIQQQLARTPKTADVELREDFVDRRLRRRQRAAERTKQLAAEAAQALVDVAPEGNPEPEVKEELRNVAPVKVEEPVKAEPVKKKATKKAPVKKKTTRKIKKKTEES